MEVILVLIAIAAGVFIYGKRVGFDYYSNKREEEGSDEKSNMVSEPTVFEMAEHLFREQLFKELGVEIKASTEEKDRYIVGYQGGNYEFVFGKQNHFIRINYYGFYSCSKKDLEAAYIVANTINLNRGHWTCFLSQSEEVSETPISADLCYLFAAQGSVKICAEALRTLLPMCFDYAREFNAEMERMLKEEESVSEHHADGVFNQQMQLIRNRREIGHSHAELEEEYPLKENQTLSGFLKLFQDVDFGCMSQMKILVGNDVEQVTDLNEIANFDIREYIKNHPHRMKLDNMTLLVEFEKENLVINMKKVSRESEKTLFFRFSVMRTGSLMDVEHEKINASSIGFNGMLEVRLTTENEDYWEAKYIVDDALDKWNNGKAKELTDEQRMIVSCVSPSTRMDMYWAKKYYNKGCLLQSLPYFKRILYEIKLQKSTPDSELRDLYNEMNFYIGFIYMDLKMYETAYHYLHIAQRGSSIPAIEEFINCLCNVRDWDALAYIRDIYERALNSLKEAGDEADDALIYIYRFTKRRLVYRLIVNDDLEEAELMLKEMIDNGEDAGFAKMELEYIKKLRGEENK